MASWFSGPTIRDDRGKRVPLALEQGLGTSASRRLREASKLPAPRPTPGEVLEALGRGLLMAAVSLAAMLGPVWFMITRGVGGRVLRVGSFLAGVGVLLWLTIWLARGTSVRRRARILRSAGLCASCGYDLDDVPAQEDACRICPECGSAWRASPSAPGPKGP